MRLYKSVLSAAREILMVGFCEARWRSGVKISPAGRYAISEIEGFVIIELSGL